MPIYFYNVTETRYVVADTREEADELVYNELPDFQVLDQDIMFTHQEDEQ